MTAILGAGDGRAVAGACLPRVVALALMLLVAPTTQAADVVRATIERESAWTGEAVPMVITLFSPGPFDGTPSFDLPDLPLTVILKMGGPVVGSEVVDGDTWFTQRHQFQLSTQQAGEIVVPPFNVDFRGKKTFTSDLEPMNGMTAELRFRSNRPPGTEQLGVVIATTNMSVSQTWGPEDIESVKAGDVIHRVINRSAVGTTAMLIPPAASKAPEGVQVYLGPPSVNDETERGEARAERSDLIKYQFQRSGTIELPELSFTWWDPQAEELKSTTLAGRTFEVQQVEQPGTSELTDKSEEQPSRWAWLVIVGIGCLAWTCRKPMIQLAEDWKAIRNCPTAIAARNVKAACRSNDASKAYFALLDWHRSVQATAAEDLTYKQAFSQTGLRCEWDRLSAFLFSRHSGHAGWSGGTLLSEFLKARAELEDQLKRTERTLDLPELNPNRSAATNFRRRTGTPARRGH